MHDWGGPFRRPSAARPQRQRRSEHGRDRQRDGGLEHLFDVETRTTFSRGPFGVHGQLRLELLRGRGAGEQQPDKEGEGSPRHY